MTDAITIRIEHSFTSIPPASWDRLAGASKGHAGTPYNPFVSHAYLSALEESGSATAETGWLGQHLLMEDADGSLRGRLSATSRATARGSMFSTMDGRMPSSVPAAATTRSCNVPCPSRRQQGRGCLRPRGATGKTVGNALAAGLKELTRRHGLSSAHVTFVPVDEMAALEQAGFLHRMDQQFHFINQGYGSHDDFLATLASRKRKALKRERRAAVENGITIDWLTGSDLTEEIWTSSSPSTWTPADANGAAPI